jgi:hypothetical protein
LVVAPSIQQPLRELSNRRQPFESIFQWQMEGAAKIMHLIIPLLLMVAEGKCDFQLLLQYSPEK